MDGEQLAKAIPGRAGPPRHGAHLCSSPPADRRTGEDAADRNRGLPLQTRPPSRRLFDHHRHRLGGTPAAPALAPARRGRGPGPGPTCGFCSRKTTRSPRGRHGDPCARWLCVRLRRERQGGRHRCAGPALRRGPDGLPDARDGRLRGGPSTSARTRRRSDSGTGPDGRIPPIIALDRDAMQGDRETFVLAAGMDDTWPSRSARRSGGQPSSDAWRRRRPQILPLRPPHAPAPEPHMAAHSSYSADHPAVTPELSGAASGRVRTGARPRAAPEALLRRRRLCGAKSWRQFRIRHAQRRGPARWNRR